MSKRKELTNTRFERLLVIKRVESNFKGNARWLCRCDCGKEIIVLTYSLTSGHTKSCGCYSHDKFKESITTHGQRHTKLYSIWCGMKQRCYNERHENYLYYGGNGIEICEEWANNFVAFMDWAMQNGYKEPLEIDRKDSNGNYEPENCKWSTRTEQVRNRSNTVFITFNCQKKTLKEWCEIFKVNYKTTHAKYMKGASFYELFQI